MPRRSNAFQALVHRIETALHDTEARVEECAMIHDFAADKDIEVDVLVSFEVGGREYRTVVECRDWGRPQGPQWVRDLATKRDDCRLDRMVAASASGFTRPACRVAESHNITTIHVSEASSDDLVGSVIPLPYLTFAVALCSAADFCNVVPAPPFDLPKDRLFPQDIRIELPIGRTFPLEEAISQTREAVGADVLACVTPSQPTTELPEEKEGVSPIHIALVFPPGTRLVLPSGEGWQINQVLLAGHLYYSVKYLNGRDAFLYGQRPVEEASGEILKREVRVTFADGAKAPGVYMPDAQFGPARAPSASDFDIYYKPAESNADWTHCLASGTDTGK